MAPSEWNQVVELFHAALERSGDDRAQLLNHSCGVHTLLRKTVEEMLKEHESDKAFLSEPLLAASTSAPPSDPVPLNPRFEHFVLLDLLGRGGMGEVWSAHDAELDRVVALKLLRAETASELDTAHIAREAKAASALNHPNIVTIHGLVRSESCSAIVMELVQGRSLAELRGTLLPLNEVLSIAVQISKALAAAHANGIIHGDIKPENIMLRDDGYVKVLDFGLARRAVMEASAGAPGPVFGTLRYMSPEQAHGDSLTPVSDIFSFGLVLFELATGRRAFDDASPLDALQATLTHDPPAPASVNPQIPADLNSLILAMLVKDPVVRPSASEVARKLAENLQTMGERAAPEAARPRGGTRLWQRLAAVLVTSVVALTAGWFVFVRKDSPQFANLRIQPLTSQPGWEGSPAISPDGKSIAFTWTERADTPPQLYVKQLNDSAPIRLTDSHSEGAIGSLAWSPDGKSIAFMRQVNGSSPIFVIPSSGGDEKKILDTTSPYLSARIDWSPDATELAYSDLLPESERLAIYLFNLRTGKQRRLTSLPPGVTGDWNPRFSPDGRTIAFKRASGFWADDMYTVPVAGGEPRRVTWEGRGIWGHAWTADGKGLILSCQRGTTIFGLWRFPLTTQSRPEPIVQGGVDAITPATSRKTARLAWANQIQDVNIYRVALTGSEQPVRLIASTLRDQHPAYSSNALIAFVSDRSGSREIWLARPDGTGQKRITSFNGPDVGDLQWSPDGRHLAFYGRAQGDSDIFTIDCDPVSMHCGSPKRVTSGIRAEVPSWSADGEFLYFASDQTERSEVWKQAASGGEPVQVTHNGGYAARESQDGKWLYFSKNRSEGIWRMPVAHSGRQGVSAEELVIGPPNHVQQKGWTLVPDGIVFTERAGGGKSSALRAYQFSSKQTRLIAPLLEGFEGNREYGISVSSDSRWVLYSQLDRSGSNVMVADIP